MRPTAGPGPHGTRARNVHAKSLSSEVVECDLRSVVWGPIGPNRPAGSTFGHGQCSACTVLKTFEKSRGSSRQAVQLPMVLRVLALTGSINCPGALCDRVITLDSKR